MERKLNNKMGRLNYISSNYQEMWNSSDEEILANLRNNFNFENYRGDLVYEKLSEIRSENIHNSLETKDNNSYQRMIDLCELSIELIKKRKLKKDTYEFFRDTPKESFWLAIPDYFVFVKELRSQL